MPDYKRTVKLITEQHVIDKPSGVEGYPLRKWNIEIKLVDPATGDDVPAGLFEKAVYHLHESFGKRAKQTFKKPPFRCEEEGWGEFDMSIVLTAVHKGGEFPIAHDLNFQSERYEATHEIVFKNPKPDVLAALGEAGDANGARGKATGGKKGRGNKNVDMEKLADGLQRLEEDDLLHVVQMVHDNKTPETYTKNDVENGEFHVDLYTLPDHVVKMLWDFTASKVDLA